MSAVRVSGFTFVRNAVRLDYPIVESIRSILPVVDEFVVNVGPSDDGTLELIRSIDDAKIRVLCSEWNDHTNQGGYVYAQQTNIALFNCRGQWAFYLQADEVVHDEDLPHLDQLMRQYADDASVDGLALQQITFWGDYATQMSIWPLCGSFRSRIVKPHHFVLSRGDALGFTVHPKYKERGRRLRVVETEARQFHYCVLKSVSALEEKRSVEAQRWSERSFAGWESEDAFYQVVPRCFVDRYEGTHPSCMADRIARYPFTLDLDSPQWRTELRGKERRQWMRHRLFQLTRGRGFPRGCYRKVA